VNLLEIIPDVMEPHLLPKLQEYIKATLPGFKQSLNNHPLKDHIGGISICEAFWLYRLTIDLDPTMVIESGTLYGFSLWFLHQAVGQTTPIFSFDPGYKPKYTIPGVYYFEKDWTDVFTVEDPPAEGSMVFFDDHQDQDRRLAEALDRGVRDIVFHYNYTSLKHSHKPIRYCELPKTVEFCFTFPCLRDDPVFEPNKSNAQTYRWLTWLRLGTL
jgi:hypothetical protein